MSAAFTAALAATLILSSCVTSQPGASSEGSSPITVEGNVTVRGNEPFARYVMETDQNNYYVLVFEDGVAPDTPAAMRVTGRVYRANWDSRPFAHIDVVEYESAP